MGAPRGRRALIKSRRRVDEGGEEEDSAVAPQFEDDSLSEASLGSDADEDADEDADGERSDDSEIETPDQEMFDVKAVANGDHAAEVAKPSKLPSEIRNPTTTVESVTKDTEAVLNGLTIAGDGTTEEIHYDDMNKEESKSSQPAPSPRNDPTAARRRDHEEYKKKRAADPAFVPNRGGFFMHDHRTAAPGQNGFRPFGKNGPRGRGNPHAFFGPSSQFQSSGSAEVPWTHDLHDFTLQPHLQAAQPMQSNLRSSQMQASVPTAQSNSPAPNRSFSETIQLGTLQIRVLLAGMPKAKSFSGIPRFLHILLPQHRPPLRRDKPVRISLPGNPVRYIFPSTNRSFVFIPRALRPNQQGFGKAKGRSGFGSSGALSSRRTSIYGGSNYSPSVVLSRRSSLAREVMVAGLHSPSQALRAQDVPPAMEAGKPVVRLPPSGETHPGHYPMAMSPVVNTPSAAPYSVASIQQVKGPNVAEIPMYHPKPERSLQVADIESPVAMEFQQTMPQQQPFHQQMPKQYPSQAYPPVPMQYTHSRHASRPSQASEGTPLPQIPETAVHAHPFQPFPYAQPPAMYTHEYPAPIYYYPSPEQGANSPGTGSQFIPNQQYFYPMGMPSLAMQPQMEATTQAGTVAHEAGGTVYYYNPSELAPAAENSPSFPSPYPNSHPALDAQQFYPQTQLYYPPPQ